MRVYLARDLREASKNCAQKNRELLENTGIIMVNVLGAPGAGKTSLLEETLKAFMGRYRASVIEGDLYTSEDAQRLERWCRGVVQINTEGACHLEAGYIGCLLTREKEPLLAGTDIIFVENIGNLICPAEFDLGEDIRVSLLSVAEGNDKPRKYPLVFKEAHAVVITKCDLMPYVDFDLERAVEDLRLLNEELEIFPLSTKTGEGVEAWCSWLKKQLESRTKTK